MYNHEPLSYDCPFCRIINQAKQQVHQPSDVIYSAETVTAFLAHRRQVNNLIDVLVVPNAHFENIYDLPREVVPDIHKLSRAIAISIKTVCQCDGVLTRQHNEPAGDQDVWHYHVHVTHHFTDDNFYSSEIKPFPENERLEHAERLREFMVEHESEIFSI